MYKLLGFFVFLSLTLAIMPEQSHAYSVRVLKPEEFKSAFDSAFFVGKAEIVKIDENPVLTPEEKADMEKHSLGTSAPPVFITLRPLQSYKTPHNEDFIIYLVGTGAPTSLKPGMIFEYMIFSNEYKYPSLYWSQWHFKGKYHWAKFVIPDEAWAKYRKTALPSSRLRNMEQECSKKGGKLFTEQHQVYCHLPTSDAGKLCLDNKECERFCFAVVSKEESRTIQSHQIDKHYESIKRQGKCGKWKNQEGYFNFVEKGVVTPLNTIGYGDYK